MATRHCLGAAEGHRATLEEALEDTPLITSTPEQRSLTETLRLTLTAGTGLLADGYDLTVINLVIAMLGNLYPRELGAVQQGLIVSATLVGVIVGQVTFGILADVMGRRAASLASATLTLAGAGMSACISGTVGLAFELAACRFILGLGIGGEYPVSAALGKELETKCGAVLVLSRKDILVINQVVFNLGAVFQSLLVLTLLTFSVPMEVMWRLALAGGVIPSCVALLMRLRILEPQPMVVDGRLPDRVQGALRTYLETFSQVVGPQARVLAGACLCWFLFNIVAYSLSSFSHIVVDEAMQQKNDQLNVKLWRDASFVLVTSLAGVAGCFVAMPLLKGASSRTIQLWGFALTAIMGLVTGALLGRKELLIQVMMAQVVGAVGLALVGVTTYMVPSEHFPTVVRATCVGVAAASGKVGAAVGTAIYPLAVATLGLQAVMFATSLVMLAACAATVALIPGGDFGDRDKA